MNDQLSILYKNIPNALQISDNSIPFSCQYLNILHSLFLIGKHFRSFYLRLSPGDF